MDHSQTLYRFAFVTDADDPSPAIATEWDCHNMRYGHFDVVPYGKFPAIIDTSVPPRNEWEKPLVLSTDEAESILKWEKKYVIVTRKPTKKVTFNLPADLRDMPWDDFFALTGP